MTSVIRTARLSYMFPLILKWGWLGKRIVVNWDGGTYVFPDSKQWRGGAKWRLDDAERNKQTTSDTQGCTWVTSSASRDHLHSDSCHRAKMLDCSKPKGVTRLRLHKSTETLVTHSEGEVRSQRRRVEIIKDGVLEVWKLQPCGDTKTSAGQQLDLCGLLSLLFIK